MNQQRNNRRPRYYKYQDSADYRLKSLEEGYLWFSYPSNFNDMYDGRIDIQDDLEGGCTFAPEGHCDAGHSLEMLRKLVLDSYPGGVNAKCRSLMVNANMQNAAIQWAQQEISSSELIRVYEQGLKSIGILSLATSAENHLMWAYYAESLQGYCVEYQSLDIVASGIRPVSYTSNYRVPGNNRIYMSELLFSPRLPISDLMTTKDANWSHEDERRAIQYIPEHPATQNDKGFGVTESEACLEAKAIIPGPKISPDLANKLKEIANQRGLEVRTAFADQIF